MHASVAVHWCVWGAFECVHSSLFVWKLVSPSYPHLLYLPFLSLCLLLVTGAVLPDEGRGLQVQPGVRLHRAHLHHNHPKPASLCKVKEDRKSTWWKVICIYTVSMIFLCSLKWCQHYIIKVKRPRIKRKGEMDFRTTMCRCSYTVYSPRARVKPPSKSLSLCLFASSAVFALLAYSTVYVILTLVLLLVFQCTWTHLVFHARNCYLMLIFFMFKHYCNSLEYLN